MVLLLVSSCSMLGQPPAGAASSANATNATNVSDNQTATQQTNQTVPSGDQIAWDYITKSNVEKDCLLEAKAYATSQGVGPGAVFSCTCNASEGQDTKAYICDLEAVDGTHTVAINCDRENDTCAFLVDRRSSVMTLQEIYAMANGG